MILSKSFKHFLSHKGLYDINLHTNRKLIYRFCTSKGFSNNTEKIKTILKSIQIQNQNNQHSNLLDSGIIVHQHLDPQTKKLTLSLNLTKDYMKIKSILKSSLNKQGFNNLDIKLAPKQKQTTSGFDRKGNLNKIKKIIAVSSCKGGVGKSTVAINLAASLRNSGFSVGIFDADIYGPSLPTLINKQGEQLEASQENAKQIKPKVYQDMKCMSFGFVGSKPAAMRGPMVSSIISQLLLQTVWGDLDYLVVDMPPGTGDIQISLCQQLKFDGALIIMTPQRLAFMDVIKGIQMFQDLRVRILGVVQNMSYYECSKCGNKDQIFGKGYTKMLMEQFGIQNSFRIPLISDISKSCDQGTPLAFVLPEQHNIVKIYKDIQKGINSQLDKPKIKVNTYYNTGQRAIIIEQQNKKKKIDPYTLRINCKCAGCIDQFTGSIILKKDHVDPEVHPVRIEEKGNYAVAIVWSDGHRSSIYPYKRLLSEQIPGK